jgi:hypothetical protein
MTSVAVAADETQETATDTVTAIVIADAVVAEMTVKRQNPRSLQMTCLLALLEFSMFSKTTLSFVPPATFLAQTMFMYPSDK